MIRLLSVAIVLGLIYESCQQMGPSLAFPCAYPTHIQCWTRWFNRDRPSATGDWETLSDLRNENPGAICPNPLDIEATTVSGESVASTGETIHFNNPNLGFACRNEDQSSGMCSDYRVRFSCHPPFCAGVCWTKWFDRDDPSATGDWETQPYLNNENPGEICQNPFFVEAVTTDTGAPAISTGQVIHIYNPTIGFACRNDDQPTGTMCLDYKVRFGCQCP